MDIPIDPLAHTTASDHQLIPRATTTSAFPFGASLSFPSGFPFDGSTPTITLPSISTPTLPSIQGSTPTSATGSTGQTTLVTTTVVSDGRTGAVVFATAAVESSAADGAGARRGGGGLTAGAAAGIGVACTLVGLALVGAGVWLFLRRRKRRRLEDAVVGPATADEGRTGSVVEKRVGVVEADPSSQVYESAAREVAEVDGGEKGKEKAVEKGGESYEMAADMAKVAELPGSVPDEGSHKT